jgi:hypothetical protein
LDFAARQCCHVRLRAAQAEAPFLVVLAERRAQQVAATSGMGRVTCASQFCTIRVFA